MMPKIASLLAITLPLLMGAQPPQQAAAPAALPPVAQRPQDAQAITDLVAQFEQAFNAADVPALIALFTDDALVITTGGESIDGKENIAAWLKSSFQESPGLSIKLQTGNIRFLGPETAVESGMATLKNAEGNAEESSPYSVIYQKRNGRWLQAFIRDEPPLADERSPHDRLMELEWMIGKWVHESDDAAVHVTCDWADNGNFLIRKFEVKIAGQVSLAGTQRLGWDPLRKQFRIWTFDDEGGFGEGYLSRAGQDWLLHSSGVRPDGQAVSFTSVVTPIDAHRIAWRTSDRTVGGEAFPGLDEVILVKEPPLPSEPKPGAPAAP